MLVAVFQKILQMSFWGSMTALGLILIKKTLGSRFSSRWQYAIWMVLLVKLLVPISFSMPGNLSIHRLESVVEQMAFPEEEALPPFSEGKDAPEMGASDGPDRVLSPEINPVPTPNQVLSNPEKKVDGWLWGARLWLAGVMVSLLIYGLSYGKMLRLIGREARPLDQKLQSMLQEELNRGTKGRQVAGVMMDAERSPFVLLTPKPTLVLSTGSLKGLGTEEIREMIRHELAHIAGGDPWVRLLFLGVQSLHWFNPIIWIALREMVKDCEAACDERVIRWYDEAGRRRYASTLVKMAERQQEKVPLGASAFGEHFFKRRVMQVIKYKKQTIIGTLGAILILVLAGCVFLTEPTPEEPPLQQPEEIAQVPQDNSDPSPDLGEEIERLLEEIMATGNGELSNPFAYINNNETFDKLVATGPQGLAYMSSSFKKSNEDGLREYIMALACAKIMGIPIGETGIGISSGRDWFHKFLGVMEGEDGPTMVDVDIDLFPSRDLDAPLVFPPGVDQKNLEEVLNYYLLAMERGAYAIQGEKAFISYLIHGREDKAQEITLYLEVLFSAYGFENGHFVPVSSSGPIPTRVVLEETPSGYQVKAYQQAMDGGLWRSSIEEMFPAEIARLVLTRDDSRQNQLREMMEKQASAYLASINRDGPGVIQSTFDRFTQEEGRRKAISLVTAIQRDFPHWEGSRELLYRTGGKAPGAIVRAVLQTECEPIPDGGYQVTLTKEWQITVNGIQPKSYWIYRVVGDKMELIESQDQEYLIQLIK